MALKEQVKLKTYDFMKMVVWVTISLTSNQQRLKDGILIYRIIKNIANCDMIKGCVAVSIKNYGECTMCIWKGKVF